MHTQLDLPNRHEAFLDRQERMLLVGMDDFTARLLRLVMLRDGGDGEIDQIVVVVDPHVQDRLHLHLLGVGVVRPHLISRMQLSQWLVLRPPAPPECLPQM